MIALVTALFILSFIPFLLLMVFIFIKKINKKKFNNRMKDIKENSPYRKTQNNIKPKNDFLFLEKEENELNFDQELDKVEKISPRKIDKDEGKVVGVVKPKGFWSKFIMSQKMGFIFARLAASENKGEGFWTNLIKAQDVSQGKDKGRGR